MSVLIRGMEMPTHCMDCPFMVSRDNDDCILQSDEANENFESWEQMKAGCPLIEVPEPHGRLIDADALMKRMWDETDCMICMISVLATFVRDAPTIIQSSEEAE